MSDNPVGKRFLSQIIHPTYTLTSRRIGNLAISPPTRYSIMRYLISLFAPRPLHRSFALLDRNGHCQAFKQCSLQPMGDGWVEIEEIRLNWLHQPLPASARVIASQPRARVQAMLSI